MSAAKAPSVEEKEAPAQGCPGIDSVPRVPSAAAPPEQRILLHGIRWETYESLLSDLENSSGPRLTYDRGTLEIMSPLPKHERSNRLVAALVETITEEWGQEVDSLGSTTFRRQDVERGFEPDSCFYLQHAETMRDKAEIDLTIDPPPDLVLEIDITHSCLPKLPIYAQFGVPEVWRYNGSSLKILVLENGEYQERGESSALPGANRDQLSALLREQSSLGRIAWLRRVREWAHQHQP